MSELKTKLPTDIWLVATWEEFIVVDRWRYVDDNIIVPARSPSTQN